MHIEFRKVTDVVPYEANPLNNDGAVEAVARSINEFGWRQPMVVDKDGVTIVGRTRFKTAQTLGLDLVPVHVASDMSPEQAHA